MLKSPSNDSISRSTHLIENIAFADELVKEYLIFRGFTQSYKTFNLEKKHDKTRGFQVFTNFFPRCINYSFTTSNLVIFGIPIQFKTDILQQAIKVVELLLHHIHTFNLTSVLELWSYLNDNYFQRAADTKDLLTITNRLELSLKR
jgi:hypothetical protein